MLAGADLVDVDGMVGLDCVGYEDVGVGEAN